MKTLMSKLCIVDRMFSHIQIDTHYVTKNGILNAIEDALYRWKCTKHHISNIMKEINDKYSADIRDYVKRYGAEMKYRLTWYGLTRKVPFLDIAVLTENETLNCTSISKFIETIVDNIPIKSYLSRSILIEGRGSNFNRIINTSFHDYSSLDKIAIRQFINSRMRLKLLGIARKYNLNNSSIISLYNATNISHRVSIVFAGQRGVDLTYANVYYDLIQAGLYDTTNI